MQDSQHGQLDEQVAGELKRLITKFRIRIGSLPVRNTHSSSSEPLTSKQSYKTNKMSLDHPRCSRLRFSVGQSVYKEFASFVSILLADFVFLPNVFALNFPRLHFRFHLHFQLYIICLLVLLPLLIILLLFLLLLLLIPLLFSYGSSYSFSAYVETNIVSLIIMSPA